MTDQSMVERVAHAIFPELWDSDADYASSYPLSRKRVEKGRVEALTRAHAAIEAMRDASDEMLTAGGDAVHKRDPYEDEQIAMARGVWQAMIDDARSRSAGEEG